MPTTYAIPDGELFFNATTYTGNGASPRTIANQYGFQPDFVWVKNRTAAGNRNRLQNSVVGANKLLFSDSTDSEQTNEINGYVSAFTSSGFTLTAGSSSSTGTNSNGDAFVAWQWQAGQGTTSNNTSGTITSTVSVNTTSGFSIVTYTGNGTNGATVGHGLGASPGMIIIKRRDTTSFWMVAHSSLSSGNNLILNLTNAQSAATGFTDGGIGSFNSTTFTCTQGVSSSANINANNGTYVAYCWAPVAGYSAFGSYTGNGSSDGPFVYLGFRPKFVMVKSSSAAGESWFIADTSRSTFNVATQYLIANNNDAEGNTAWIDMLSNGFKIRFGGAGPNTNGATYIYMAFAENPLKFANAR